MRVWEEKRESSNSSRRKKGKTGEGDLTFPFGQKRNSRYLREKKEENGNLQAIQVRRPTASGKGKDPLSVPGSGKKKRYRPPSARKKDDARRELIGGGQRKRGIHPAVEFTQR